MQTTLPPRATPDLDTRPVRLLLSAFVGVCFGVVLLKSEAASWFRMQEMFRFQSFHMYGLLGSAVAVAAVSLRLMRRFGAKDVHGVPVAVEPKEYRRGISQAAGGLLFGVGWALLGACPGPIYALIGSGESALVVGLASALAGAWVYGHLRPRLPH